MLWCQVAELDIFQLEVFGEICFRKQVCLEGTSLRGLLTPSSEEKSLYKCGPASEVESEVKVGSPKRTSQSLLCAIPLGGNALCCEEACLSFLPL